MSGVIKDFSGRAKFNKTIQALAHSGVRVGVLAGERGDGLSNAELLYINEHGDPQHNVPPRPVVRIGINKVERQISSLLTRAAVKMVNGKDGRSELTRAGEIAVFSIKATFGSADLAPNAPNTIARKGFNSPLIDTAALRNSIAFEVKDPKRQETERETGREPGETEVKIREKALTGRNVGKYSVEGDVDQSLVESIGSEITRTVESTGEGLLGAAEGVVEGVAEVGELALLL